MSNDSKTGRTEILEWLKGGGLLVITIIGLLLYLFLSLPATIFYARLGTTPGEVGITYTSLLSGSTAEITIILILLALIFLSSASAIAFLSFLVRGYIALSPYIFTRISRKSLQDLTDAEWEERIRVYGDAYGRLPELIDLPAMIDPKWPRSFDEMEGRARRHRELLRLGVRTAEQSAELELIESQNTQLNMSDLSRLLAKNWIRRNGWSLAIFFVVVTIGVLLPLLAFVQAGNVRDGKVFPGETAGVFSYRADLVKVEPTSQYTALGVQMFKDKELFLLGQNEHYIILYSPTSHSTIRVPPVAVTITSV